MSLLASDRRARHGWRRPALRLMLTAVIGAAAFLILALCVNVVFALRYTEPQALPGNAVIVVLTGGNTRKRVDTALDVYRAHGADQVVLTGIALAELMVPRAVEGGVPADKIRIETESRSTLQNALFAEGMLPGEQRPIILVTERYHLLRSWLSFRWAGFDGRIVLFPADRPEDYDWHRSRKLFPAEAGKWGVNLVRGSLASALSAMGMPQNWFIRLLN